MVVVVVVGEVVGGGVVVVVVVVVAGPACWVRNQAAPIAIIIMTIIIPMMAVLEIALSFLVDMAVS